MRLTYGGQFFSYEQEGGGPVPVVFLHGWGTSPESFRTISRYLGKRYTAYLLDIPGFGETPLPNDPLHVPQVAEQVRNLAQALHLPPLILVGHGLSAKIMVSASARFVGIIDGLILVDAVGPRQSRWLSRANHIVASHQRLWRMPGFYEYRRRAKQKLVSAIGFQDYTLTRFMSDSFDLLIHDDSLATASLINRPALLLWGNRDARSHIADGRSYARAVKNSSFRLIPGFGHLDPGRDAETFSRVLLTVLG